MEGKSRSNIENLTECYISVYGKTIAVIGKIDMVNICKRAVESLLGGSPHANVYKWLERQRRLLKKRSFEEGGF
jgi:ribosomal RNA assembly protein